MGPLHASEVLARRWEGHPVLYSPFLLIVIYSSILFYRLTFHPLARYPGRLSEKLSGWPLVFHCNNGNRHIKQRLAHEKFGPIVRDGPNSLSFRSPSALQAIYGNNAHVKKGDWYLTLDISAGAPSIQMVRDHEQHALRRRVISPAFSQKALQDAEPFINLQARKLCEKLVEAAKCDKSHWSEPLDLYQWLAYYGYDFVSDLTFGHSFELLHNETHRFIPQILRSTSQWIYYMGYLPCIAVFRPLLGTWVQDLVPSKHAKDSLRYTNLANNRLAERIEQERQSKKSSGSQVRRDVFHYLLNSKDLRTGKSFTTEELQADTALLIAAGSDGVTTAVGAVFFYVLQNPRILAKLRQEICDAFHSPEEIKTPNLNKLPYLHACIEESLRISPPKPGSLPRVVLPGGTEIDGHHIPAGTTVGVSHYVIHRNADVFPGPTVFRPERWIVGEGVTAEQIKVAKQAFCPFSIGPMNCIGKSIAYLAMKLAVAHLLWKFDFRTGDKGFGGGNKYLEEGRRDETEYQLYDWILGFPNGPIVQLRLRN